MQPLIHIFIPKLDIMASNKWPAVILAARRTPKDTILAKKLTVSIKTSAGDRAKGAPSGVKMAKNSPLKFIMEYRKVPITIVKERPIVMAIWTVGEKT